MHEATNIENKYQLAASILKKIDSKKLSLKKCMSDLPSSVSTWVSYDSINWHFELNLSFILLGKESNLCFND